MRAKDKKQDPWSNFLLAEVMAELRRSAAEDFGDGSDEYKKAPKSIKEAAKKLKTELRSIHEATTDNANQFIKEASGKLRVLLRADGASDAQAEQLAPSCNRPEDREDFWALNGRVGNSLTRDEKYLRLYLPDLAEIGARCWPGPVSYRSALNHYVAVCIRVHSIMPQVAFEEITFHAAKKVLVPAIAHNLKLFAKEHPEIYHAFVHDTSLKFRLGMSMAKEWVPKGVRTSERYLIRKWLRLFNVCVAKGKYISIERRGELFREVQELLLDYEAEPRTSRLWADLSILASGDMAVDEMLVACVLEEVGGDRQSLATSPLVNCARARFGLLRYAYLMTKEAAEFAANFDYGHKETAGLIRRIDERVSKGKPLGTDIVNEIFGWAYLLSRHNLLGRRPTNPASKKENTHRSLAAERLHELLAKAYDVKEKECNNVTAVLALRYALGFLTNPRFIKPASVIRKKDKRGRTLYSSEKIEEYITAADNDPAMPKSIVHLAKARVALHHAAMHRSSPDKYLRELKSSLGHYSEILAVLATPQDAGIMDGEVIAWALPEMYYAMGQLAERDKETHWQPVLQSLLVLGEVQYGVYYNPKEECARIEEGLRLAVE